MKKIVCLLAGTLVLSQSLKAQMSCSTDKVYEQLKAKNPDIGILELKLGAAIQEALEKEKTGGVLSKSTGTVYDVPIVVHIIHDYGTEYVTDDEIFAAVEYWDKVFNAENSDTADVITPFKKWVGNPEIRLRLATKDPNGNPTKGITRRQSYLSTSASDLAKMDYWPSNQYINVWFINKFNSDHAGAAAYAYYPSSAHYFPHYDGIIGLASYLNFDKAIPHEFGHVLNLAHTWGNTNDPGVACGDDGVDDTPPTKGHVNCVPAALYDTTCASGYIKGGIDYPDTTNTQNIMDYAYCQKMFTIGQSNRMRAALTSATAGRNNLYTATNLSATGALLPRPDLVPVSDFSVERGAYGWGGLTSERVYFLCQGSSTKFMFKNRSWNDTVTAVEWIFSNGADNPTSASLSSNVQNGFADAGWVTVTLKATGNNSGTSTVSKQAVYVASTNTYARGYNQYFGAAADFADWPIFNYYNNNFKWEFSPSGGYPDNWGCLRFRSFDTRTTPERYSGTASGDHDDIFTPAFDLTSFAGETNVNLNFYTAGCATTNTEYGDSLQIFASTNCGDSWTRVTTLKFTDIINNSLRNTEFIPSSGSDWKAHTINIPAAMRTNRTFFRFRYWASTGGNNLYMDNFTVSPWATEINEVQQNGNSIKLFPNPTSGNTQLCFTTAQDGAYEYTIRDITGKLVFQKSDKTSPNTFVQENISRSNFAAPGVYLVTLTNSRQSSTQKLVIE